MCFNQVRALLKAEGASALTNRYLSSGLLMNNDQLLNCCYDIGHNHASCPHCCYKLHLAQKQTKSLKNISLLISSVWTIHVL